LSKERKFFMNKFISNWDKLPAVMDLHTTALIFGVTDGTIKKWLYKGIITGHKVGRKWFFDKDYLHEIMKGE